MNLITKYNYALFSPDDGISKKVPKFWLNKYEKLD